MTRLNLSELAREQAALRTRLVLRDDFDPGGLRVVAGMDLTFLEPRRARTRGLACASLHRYPSMEPLERVIVEAEVAFPYVPGFLAYRELPLLLKAYERVRGRADLYLLDGHGIAHPRGLGIASHFGVETGEVAVGCAKTRLCGRFTEPGNEAGDASSLVDGEGRPLGTVLRTKRGTAPVFVSPGHRIALQTATEIVKACVKSHRLPEPTRSAHTLLQGARRARIDEAGRPEA